MPSRLLKAVLLTPLRLGVHFVALVVFMIVAVTLVQQVEILFEKTELSLPDMTFKVVAISNWLVKFWYLLFVLLVVVDAPVLFLLQSLPHRMRWLVQVWFVGFLLLILLLIGWVGIAIAVPIRELGALRLIVEPR